MLAEPLLGDRARADSPDRVTDSERATVLTRTLDVGPEGPTNKQLRGSAS